MIFSVSKGYVLNRAIIGQNGLAAPNTSSLTSQTSQPELLPLDGALILSGHQPTLLPYPGFFYRMYHSTIMDICPYDPFSRHHDRYQHRVKIGSDQNWRWLTMPVEAQSGCSIMDVKLKTHLLPERWSELQTTYKNYPLWSEHREALRDIFFGYTHLWELNLRFILWIRDLLDIKTYVSLSYGGCGCDTTERVASQFGGYGKVIYLAGKGSIDYLDMRRYEQLTNSTIAMVTYTPPPPYSTVSMLSALLTYPPKEALEQLNIRREPIKVVVDGAQYSINYLNCTH